MSDYFDRVERQIVRSVEAGVPRSRPIRRASGYLGLAAAVLVVIVVAGAFLLARGGGTTGTPAVQPPAGQVTVTLVREAPGSTSQATLNRTVHILRERLAAAVPAARVSRTRDRIVVRDSRASTGTAAQISDLVAPGRLAFYDWEASVLTPSGKTVASQLRSHDPSALTISQGTATLAPGDPGAGALALDQALALAAKQPASTRAVLVQAVAPGAGRPTAVETSATRYYVLRGEAALSGEDITHPRQNKDPNTGVPDVTFGFTASGANAFQAVTANIARRGARVSSLGQSLNQHFAIVLDNRLLSVPYIDYRQFPDGVSPADGADISGGFTLQSAKDIAILLRYGPLPINLRATG